MAQPRVWLERRRARTKTDYWIRHGFENRHRLLDDAPVTALGMLSVNDPLTSPGSCLFTENDDDESSLRAVLDKLEVH